MRRRGSWATAGRLVLGSALALALQGPGTAHGATPAWMLAGKLDEVTQNWMTRLMWAVYYSRPARAAELLAAGANPDLKGPGNRTALVQAAMGGKLELAEILIRFHAKLDLLDDDRRSALSYTVGNHDLAVARALLDAGANPNLQGGWSETTALYEAVDAGERLMVQLLLQHGADPNLGNDYGRTPLMEAAYDRNDAMVRRLLRAGAHVNAADQRKNTALLEAIHYIYVEDYSYNWEGLVEAELQKRRREAQERRRQLEAAELRTVQALIEAGADVNHASEYGQRALLLAIDYRRMATARRLLRAGADPDPQVGDGETVLISEVRQGNVETSLLLLQAGANPNALDTEGRTVLMLAARHRLPEVVRKLLRLGANPSARQESTGWCPILYAIDGNDWAPYRSRDPRGDEASQIVQMLLDAGADPWSRTVEGWGLIDIAKDHAQSVADSGGLETWNADQKSRYARSGYQIVEALRAARQRLEPWRRRAQQAELLRTARTSG